MGQALPTTRRANLARNQLSTPLYDDILMQPRLTSSVATAPDLWRRFPILLLPFRCHPTRRTCIPPRGELGVLPMTAGRLYCSRLMIARARSLPRRWWCRRSHSPPASRFAAAELVVTPTQVTLNDPEAAFQLLVSTTVEDQRRIDLTRKVRYESLNTKIATVDEPGSSSRPRRRDRRRRAL